MIPNFKHQLPRRSRRHGQSLLELTLALVLVAGTLVPALRLMRQALEQSRAIEQRNLIVSLAMSKLEERLAITSHNWSTGTVSGDFSSQGYSDLRYTVTHSDAATAGGLPNRLMALECTVWQDANGNAQRDSGESYVVFASKISKLAGYPQ